MTQRHSAFTLAELVVTVVGLAVLVLLFLAATRGSREESRRSSCRENLGLVGKALHSYVYVGQREFWPFAWGPATSGGRSPTPIMPNSYYPGWGSDVGCNGNPSADNKAGNRACDASASLGELYGQYLSSAKPFRCPSTDDKPVFTASVVDGGPYAVSNRTWSLGYSAPTWPSYGYDPRIVPSAVSNHPMMADMDGSWAAASVGNTQNHRGGQNVLYIDGHVAWHSMNTVSNDPNDNIFAEAYRPGNTTQGWHADTDSFMVRGSIALTSSYTHAEFSSLW